MADTALPRRAAPGVVEAVLASARVTLPVAHPLTACGGDDSRKDSSAKGSSSPSSSSSSEGGSKPEGGSEAGNAKTGSGGDTEAGTDAQGTAKTGGKVTFCKTADLAIDTVDAAPDEASGRIDITMVNRGSTTCSATGFAGVDIKGAYTDVQVYPTHTTD